jgi:hypothetical protein
MRTIVKNILVGCAVLSAINVSYLLVQIVQSSTLSNDTYDFTKEGILDIDASIDNRDNVQVNPLSNDASDDDTESGPDAADNKIENIPSSARNGASSAFNAADYEEQLKESLIALPEANTTCHAKFFLAGLCNQYMRFLGLMFLSGMEGRNQIIEESVNWKDTYGHNDFVPHRILWDVVHWNTFYPVLPRFASYDKNIHTDLALVETKVDLGGSSFVKRQVNYNVTGNIFVNATKPPPLGQNPMQSKNKYKMFVKTLDKGRAKQVLPLQLEMYETILKGALRPHPFLQSIIDKIRIQLGAENEGYMVLHARVEPDMIRQNERVCRDWRVTNMTDIINMIYEKFPEPPVGTVLIVFARSIMEDEAKKSKKDKFNILNDHNLKVINEIVENGMWGGKVKVVEAGSRMIEDAGSDIFKYYSNLVGSIVNFFLAIQSDILVGTQISTFSTLAMNSRLYREQRENYFYRPMGIHWMSPPNATKPHKFSC